MPQDSHRGRGRYFSSVALAILHGQPSSWTSKVHPDYERPIGDEAFVASATPVAFVVGLLRPHGVTEDEDYSRLPKEWLSEHQHHSQPRAPRPPSRPVR